MGLLSFPDALGRSARALSILRIRITRRKRFSGGQLRPTNVVVAGRRLILPLALALTAALSAGASPASAGGAASLLAPAGMCGPAADRTNLDVATARKAMLCLTNYARVHSGLKRLVGNAKLNQAGEAKLDADLTCGEFTHTPCGKPFDVVFASYVAGASSYALGENIAWGTGTFGTPRQTMTAWLHSSEHRQNILSSAFHELGIGYVTGQTFQGASGATLWSQEFASRPH
jgi:uncharacterized protein YkwD